MGLFSFVEEAGKKIFGTDDETKVQNLKDEVSNAELNVENFEIEIDGKKAVLTGVAESQEVKEKVVLAVGNNSGISEVEDNMTLAETEEETEVTEAQFYTVQAGDTLGKIAKEFYGDAMKYPEIFKANKPMLKSADLIYPGQSLRIPALD